ncbi:MAG: hypothetical protein HYR55_17375 [Acidobacteria bacterium]|nr:hypothetical protein [Acidobacteriota bacterium]MBI3656960.1 hypothetical protein [Acidobacteriota bacterium]
MEERDFYSESPEQKPLRITCPSCRQSDEYPIRWLRRTRKKSLPPQASRDDRARFAKMRDYLVRVDDMVACKNPRCRKRIEIPSLQSIILL